MLATFKEISILRSIFFRKILNNGCLFAYTNDPKIGFQSGSEAWKRSLRLGYWLLGVAAVLAVCDECCDVPSSEWGILRIFENGSESTGMTVTSRRSHCLLGTTLLVVPAGVEPAFSAWYWLSYALWAQDLP